MWLNQQKLPGLSLVLQNQELIRSCCGFKISLLFWGVTAVTINVLGHDKKI